MLATAGAVAGLLVGARRHAGAVARGYRWLAGAAAFWFAGLIITRCSPGRSAPRRARSRSPTWRRCSAWRPRRPASWCSPRTKRNDTGPVLPGLADGYVMAVALLVIGWVVAFGAEFHQSGERPAGVPA